METIWEEQKKAHFLQPRPSWRGTLHYHWPHQKGWCTAPCSSMCKGIYFLRKFPSSSGQVYSRLIRKCRQFPGFPPGRCNEMECFPCLSSRWLSAKFPQNLWRPPSGQGECPQPGHSRETGVSQLPTASGELFGVEYLYHESGITFDPGDDLNAQIDEGFVDLDADAGPVGEPVDWEWWWRRGKCFSTMLYNGICISEHKIG